MIKVNESQMPYSENLTLKDLIKTYKPNADLYIINGFPNENLDRKINREDSISLIKKGEKPTKLELEHLMMARHTPGVYEKLKASRVAIAGLGGLGSNVAISLARVGVGYLKLIDFDVVEPSNLNRQQYFIKHLGMFKTDALKEQVYEINPYIKVETVKVYIDEGNIASLFSDVDYIVEAFDTPENKALLINRCMKHYPKTPIIAASGLAGYYSSNSIKTKKGLKNLYLVGDQVSEAKEGCGLMAPRASIAANHQANLIVRLIMGEEI